LELLSVQLKRNGFNPVGFSDASNLFIYLERAIPELIILDLMLPDMDGFEVCKYLRGKKEYAHIPVIMLTARSAETDKITGLEIGADDYITKPFSTRELIARIKAVLRRGKIQEGNILEIGNTLHVNLQKFEVISGGEKVELTTTEFKILSMFVKRQGWVFSREQILDNLGVNDKGVLDRTVDVHIKNIREKLGKAGKYIKNIRGIGYKLET
jgi:DNA-binding response OmpR family regulator